MMVPRGPFLLGWAGVLPFAALALATVADVRAPVSAVAALTLYAAIILSFMAGAQWGIAMQRPRGDGVVAYAVSVCPALVAWFTLLAWVGFGWSARPALLILVATFLTLLVYDLTTVRRGWAPRWYGRLRVQLTAAVVVCLAVAAVFPPSA